MPDPDPAPSSRGLRQAWKRIPPGARLVIPTILLLATVIVGYAIEPVILQARTRTLSADLQAR